MAEESKGAVLAAMGANLAIAVGKLVAGLFTGSGAMLAEAGHSFADTGNQVFLLIGLNLSNTRADEKHPHGYGKEAFFWSFLAAVFIFVAGSTFSFYEGIRTLIQGDEHARGAGELALGFGVLGMAFVFEGVSWSVAVRTLVRSARGMGWSIVRYIREAPDLTIKTVFWEDSAALTGLILAALGLGVSEATGNELWDGLASCGIGVVLAAAALILGMQSRSLLLSASANPETRAKIRETVDSFPEVRGIVRMLTVQLGSHSVLVNGELEVDRSLTTLQIEDLMARIDRRINELVPEVKDTFWELHPCPPEAADAAAGSGA